MDRYVLRDYYQWSLEPNELVILYEKEKKLAGIIELTVHDDYIMIVMVGRNILTGFSGVGTRLMALAENVGRQLGKKEIRLESLDTVVKWYDGILGYEEYDEPYDDKEFGRLTPKRKLV